MIRRLLIILMVLLLIPFYSYAAGLNSSSRYVAQSWLATRLTSEHIQVIYLILQAHENNVTGVYTGGSPLGNQSGGIVLLPGASRALGGWSNTTPPFNLQDVWLYSNEDNEVILFDYVTK